MWNDLVTLVVCHLIGDYVLQSDFIAKTKGRNWYHLFVHSALYCVPFLICFPGGFHSFLFATHIVIDAGKARYGKIGYLDDQLLHYMALILFLAGHTFMQR